MNKDLGKVLYEIIHKDIGWPWDWRTLGDKDKSDYRDYAFKFAAYIGNESIGEEESD